MIVYRELSSIEEDLGFSAKTLYSLSNNLKKHYHPVDIPKRNGDTRRLYVPDEPLKSVQRAIAEKLLVLERVSPHAKAYVPGSGIVQNAFLHVRHGTILKLDIYRFFDSIKYVDVKNSAFPKERYAENIRILLAMLCHYKDVLPQGAPSSPAISNIILYDFDTAVAEYCKKQGIAYTRYCDDLTFSGEFENADELISFVEVMLKKQGLLLNRNKTKLVPSSQKQSVTGIVVNEKLNISDKYKRQIRSEIYFIRKFGVLSHLEKTNNHIPPRQYLNSLLGRINHVLHICPDDTSFKNHKLFIMNLLKSKEY